MGGSTGNSMGSSDAGMSNLVAQGRPPLARLGVDSHNPFTGRDQFGRYGTAPVTEPFFSGGTPLLNTNVAPNRDYEKLIQLGYPPDKATWMAGSGNIPTWGRVWPSPHWQIGQGHKVL